MGDIEKHNIQIMIKMIIDKLYNNTLKKYYEELSEKQDKEISDIKGTLKEYRKTIESNDKRIETLRKKMEEQSNKEKKKNKELIARLELRNKGAVDEINALMETLDYLNQAVRARENK